MKIYGLLVFVLGISAIQGLENFKLDLIFKLDRADDVNQICQNNSIWYNRSAAELHVQRLLQAILGNSAANVSVHNVAYQTEPGSWDINCANTSVTNVTVLEVNLTTSLSSGKEDVKSILNNFWHGGWNYSLVSSVIGNKSHWIACGQAKDTESTTKEPCGLHPLDCENSSTRYTSTGPKYSSLKQGICAIQGQENFQLDLIFKFGGVNDVNKICQNDSVWYNRSTAESHVQRLLQTLLSNSAANVSVHNVAYQTEPGSWDINCSNTSLTNGTNVAVLKVNLTTSLSSGKEDVKSILNTFWHGSWNYSLVSSIIGNKIHWIACGQARDTESTTKEPGWLHPLDCENLSTIHTNATVELSTGTHVSSTQLKTSKIGPTLLNKETLSTVSHGAGTQRQDGSSTTGYTSWKPTSSIAAFQTHQSQDSSGNTGYTSSKQDRSSTDGSQSQIILGEPRYSTLKQEEQKKDDPSNALAVGLGTGLGILALLVTLATIFYRYFSEKNKVSDFSGIYGFPPETPRQSDRTGKSTFRQNMA